MKLLNFLAIIIFFELFIVSISNSQTKSERPKPIFNIIKIDKPLEINGKLNNSIWLHADPIEINYEVTPGDNTPANERTIVYALYDNENLYFGFNCFDSRPKEIRANLTERDKIFSDDYVILIIDTYNDAQKGYEIAVNPYGIQGDLLATFSNEDINYNMTYYTAASINDSGWTAEMKIPFSSLSFDETDEPIWSFNAVRTIPRESRTQNSWTYIDKNIPGFMIQSGLLKGLKNIKTTSVIELLPYAIGQYSGQLTDFDNPNSDFNYAPAQGRIGGGIKYSPNPNLSFEAVANPDFSQIESDADQISVNTTFALNYEEKRPFFLVGNELLNTPVYYSRSINNPLAAGRVLGKSGSLSYLMLSAYDRNSTFVVPGEEGSNTAQTDKKSLANIGRLRYDFGDEDFLGGYVMSRNFDEGHNYVIGVDANYKFWSNWVFHSELYITQTKELNDSTLVEEDRTFGKSQYNSKLDGEKYNGIGFALNLSHSQKHYYFNIENVHVSPTFQTYNGLVSNVNFRQWSVYNSYRIYPDSSFFDRININLQSNLLHNYNGELKDYKITPSINLNMKGQTYFYAQYHILKSEKYKDIMFNNVNDAYLEISSRPLKEISLGFYGTFGKYVYRSDNPTIGKGHNLGIYFTIKPTSKLNIQFNYDRARLSDRKSNQLFYDGNIYRTVAIYQFSAEAFFRTIFQYNSFNKSFRVYPLFSYQIGAFTTFYAGATSNYHNYKEDFGFNNTDQQYFIKMQYLVSL